jgi:hypothetical protein
MKKYMYSFCDGRVIDHGFVTISADSLITDNLGNSDIPLEDFDYLLTDGPVENPFEIWLEKAFST